MQKFLHDFSHENGFEQMKKKLECNLLFFVDQKKKERLCVNFTKILFAAFLYKSVFAAFLYWQFGFEIFLAK